MQLRRHVTRRQGHQSGIVLAPCGPAPLPLILAPRWNVSRSPCGHPIRCSATKFPVPSYRASAQPSCTAAVPATHPSPATGPATGSAAAASRRSTCISNSCSGCGAASRTTGRRLGARRGRDASARASRGGVSDPFPLRVAEVPGKGRGLVATQDLSPGDLIFACEPLAIVHGASADIHQQAQPPPSAAPAPTQRPSPAVSPGRPPRPPAAAATCTEQLDLVAELQRLAWGPRQVRILGSIYRGATTPAPAAASAASAPAAASATGGGAANTAVADWDCLDWLSPWDGTYGRSQGADEAASTGMGSALACRAAGTTDAAANAEAAAAAADAAAASRAGSADGAGAGVPGLMPEELAAVVRLNAMGQASDDVLLAKLNGARNAAYLGLWPAHALMNHSCAPNAVAVVFRGRMFVRCCQPVREGEEVCISYAGALGLGPVRLRRALLERSHRFRCSCARCNAESGVPPELEGLWTDLVVLVSQQLQPRLAAAAAELARGRSAAAARAQPARAAPVAGGSSSAPVAGGSSSAPVAALLDVRDQVTRCCGVFEETLASWPGADQASLWLQASMYPLYETRARCLQLLLSALGPDRPRATKGLASHGPPDAGTLPPGAARGSAAQVAAGPRRKRAKVAAEAGPRTETGPADAVEGHRRRDLSEEYLAALSVCIRLQGVANAGSDMHVQLAARYYTACEEHAARFQSPHVERQAAGAREHLEQALWTRYGPAAAQGVSAPRREGGASVTQPAVVGRLSPSVEPLVAMLLQLQQQ